MIERKHALVRVKAGDYLLLSNDKRTLWRIAKYEEDGSATYLDAPGKPITGERWGLWRYRKPLVDATNVTIDPQEWDDFEMDECMLRSRREAIEDALGRDAR